MPKHKQPVRLRDAAMRVGATFFGSYCRKCSVEGSEDKLRRIVAFIKEDIGPVVPWTLFPEFYNWLQSAFRDIDERPICHQRIVTEIIMDRKIRGLKIDHRTLESLDFLVNDAHRIQGFTELDTSWIFTDVRVNFEAFHLQDLTKFQHPHECTDADLRIIGQNCSELRLIDVSQSKEITDDGLRALSSCKKLQTVLISGCSKLSHTGITDFLSAHETIKKISAYPDTLLPGFDCFSHADHVSVYPNMRTFSFALSTVSDKELHTVVKKFPNLEILVINGISLDTTIGWSMLRFLKKLREISIFVYQGFSWDNFKPVLRFIGDKLNVLNITCEVCTSSSCATQTELNYLYKYCPNVERLTIQCRARFDEEILTIPPFVELNALVIIGGTINGRRRAPAGLKFVDSLKLETLNFHEFKLSKKILESIILDHANFPNLCYMPISEFSDLPSEDIQSLKRIVEEKNLALHFSIFT